MDRKRITFQDLKNVCNSLNKGDEKFFCNYLNTFPGDNVLEKTRNIMRIWDQDISNKISLFPDNKLVDVQTYYLLDVFNKEIPNNHVSGGVGLRIPKEFVIPEDIFPFYSILESIETLDFSKLDEDTKKEVIDNLPAEYFNKMLKNIAKVDNFVIGFENESLKKLKFNFISNEPYYFMKGLFSSFSEDYFRDVIYILSKKIDGQLLVDSTIMDIEYYIRKMSDENSSAIQNDPTL